MTGNVWVVVEHWRGEISEITYELMALGGEIAGGLSTPLQAVLLGHEAGRLAQSLGRAETVLCADHPALAETVPEVWAEALAQLIKERAPRVVLVPLTNISMGVGTIAAAKLRAPAINFCKDAHVSGGRVVAQCVLYGGKMEAAVEGVAEPVILGVGPGSRPAEKGRAERAPRVEQVTVALPEPRIRLKRYMEPDTGDVDISKQEILVAVGRGIQSQDNLALAEELASALGGAVCGSRPVIDQGWLPLARQVGKSGMTVKPRLYIAAGISGAPEHVEGMKDAATIVAINSDPQAPIFNVAHFGIVGDATEVIPALTEAVCARQG